MTKQFLTFFYLVLLFSAINISSVLASDFSINKTNAEKGTISAEGTLGAKTVAIRIEKDGEKYDYIYSKTNKNIFPLQMGNGTYKVTIMENVSGNQYMPLVSETIITKGITDSDLYKNSIQMIDYQSSAIAIKELDKLVAGVSSEADKLDILYKYIINNFSYDYDKAAAISSGYIPVIDSVYVAKKGICYDYAAILASGLRKNGIPTKLQMGYCTEIAEYHAWNEIYVGGSWFKVDTTYDAQAVKSNVSVTAKKANEKYKTVIKQY